MDSILGIVQNTKGECLNLYLKPTDESMKVDDPKEEKATLQYKFQFPQREN